MRFDNHNAENFDKLWLRVLVVV